MSELKTEENNDRGLTGLANLGNTCFMNSCLQCLSHSGLLTEFLNNESYKKKINKIPESLITLEWDKLRKLMWNENCIISPGGFFQSVRKVARIKDKVIFTGFAQNDISEFLTFLIDCFHESIKREVEMNINGNIENDTDKLAKECYEMIKTMYKNEYSEMLNMFYGIHVSKVETKSGHYISATPEPFMMLDLAIPNKQNPTLLECVEKYVEKEELVGDNQIFNDETKEKEDGTKQVLFWSLPNILIVTLKRFSNAGNKNQVYVDFPLDTLDLSKFVIGYDKETFKYELYGVCNHSGGVLGGHYTAFVKTTTNNWYHFNDRNVAKISENVIRSPKAYCFFFRKKK